MKSKAMGCLLFFSLFVFTESTSAFTEGGSNNYFGTGAGGASGSANSFFGAYTGENNTGNYNTFLGYRAGSSNTSGSSNTFVGDYAGRANTTGGNNTFIGQYSGRNNTTGQYNTFLGQYSGYTNISGGNNTFIGNDAGYNNVGDFNTFLGRQAGYGNTSGDSNTFLGYDAGYSSTTGFNNTFVGHHAGRLSTGGSNTFIGDSAGYWNTASGNTFLGYRAGNSNSSGSNNIFIGQYAGYDNTTSGYNTFIGSYAGRYNTGSANIFIGVNAGRNNTSSGGNTFVGTNAGQYSTGPSNTFIGYLSGSNFTGSDNTFLGYYAGYGSYGNSTGGSNTFIGNSAGMENTTGGNNTFIGKQAGYINTTGQYNIFIGNGAGYYNNYIAPNHGNVYLGYNSGYSALGSYNVYIGHKAGYNSIGSNRLYIENSDSNNPLIYGEFDNNIVVINGALTATSISGNGSGLTNVSPAAHSHSGTDITSGTVADARIASTIARDSELSAHTTRTDNPHSVTAAQVGAAAVSHAHSGADITIGTVADARIASTIARDSEIMPMVLASDGIGSTLDADQLDGQHASAFMSAGTDNWVNTAGDTMYGDLLVYGIVDIDQDLYVVGNIYAESDARSKKDVQPIESSLEKIKNIQGVKFKWNREEDFSDNGHYGVIAQEVEQVLPEIVTTGGNGNKKVAYMELIPVMIEAMKEQQKIISALQEQNRQISEKINVLEKELKLKNSLAMADVK